MSEDNDKKDSDQSYEELNKSVSGSSIGNSEQQN